MEPPAAADLRHPRAALAADCSRCRALCCTGPAFTRSADFPLSKPAGVPCPNLLPDSRCGVHDRLLEGGFRGCVGYDCFGAGQRLVATLAPGPTAFALLPVVRLLHELEWYLVEVLARPRAAAVHAAAEAALTTTRGLGARVGPKTDGAAAAALAAAVEAHRREVAPVLRAASAAARAAGGPGPDRSGADLAGADLRGADLRRAALRGAVLIGADLRRADLHGADLLGADTRGADLRGADLRDALFLTRTQLDAARGDRLTQLPTWADRPAHWPA
ncbi:pentapeptide repeat-containing protein [Kineosporia sp. A_224]|uniref:pentapeptide repeat-containing protein n=1 Tax=Kineosporia sp. A_224 TaxID=1962180 RepID=UPI001E4112DC|nr:pentapeptide repeat-containing protein [Kineosporia sp. A_224]